MDIKKIFSNFNIAVSDEQIGQFEQFYKLLVEENEKYNLTAITEENEVVYKHFLDSVLPINEILPNAKLIDIGSGAGFPSVPLKIMRPDLQITMVDSLNKRVNFLNMTISKLGLSKIEAVHARAEEYIKGKREFYDYAVARAVAPLNTLLEYLVPYLKIDGRCLIYKSQKLDEEIEMAKNAFKTLSVKVVKVLEFEYLGITRKILVVEKTEKTNENYPRGKNLPKLKPL